MRIVQDSYSPQSGLEGFADGKVEPAIHLVLAFGGRIGLEDQALFPRLRARFPNAVILMGSSAGEIKGTTVSDNHLILTAIEFEKTFVRSAAIQLTEDITRHEAGRRIAEQLHADDLALVFVLSDGKNVNGSELVAGLNSIFQGKIPVVGGLAGDGDAFVATVVGLNERPKEDMIAAVGLYGENLEVNFGSQGGWESFGPERIVTEAKGNVVYKLDGKSALDLYKSYLGDRADQLPATGLLFPLSIKSTAAEGAIVRTLLAVNESENSITFAGDIPVGSIVRLMHASFDRLIDGASSAALECKRNSVRNPELAILVSCVGRKLILDQRVEEEVEEVAHVFGDATICGFYSYGELSPAVENGFCELHNQTMTITTLSER